jgi:hypothetical protein
MSHVQVSPSCFNGGLAAQSYIARRIRKVKCDEGWPACERCASTGRVCDGYGVWGGGGNQHDGRSMQLGSVTGHAQFKPSSFDYTASQEESVYLEWFGRRTVLKLPGAFAAVFWATRVMQASHSEPAVLHAIMALGSAHKKEISENGSLDGKGKALNKRERFMLQHYSKAIKHIQPHFSTKNNTSLDVGLMTCVIFVCLEFFRGNYRTGYIHLQNGLRLLNDAESRSSSVDRSVIETLVRMDVAANLFGQGGQFLSLPLQMSMPEIPATEFRSADQARQPLDRLLNEILHLTEQCRQNGASQDPPLPPRALEKQRRIRVELALWLRTYEATLAKPKPKLVVRDIFPYRLLRLYHSMAEIMVDTCLWPISQMRFDSHEGTFLSILLQTMDLQKMAYALAHLVTPPSGYCRVMSTSIADIGGIPPLYYTVIKCRNHRIRLQAAKILDRFAHKETIWDSAVALCVATEVMRTEEQDFYRNIETEDDFDFLSIPNEKDLLLPVLPESNRLQDVQVTLPDESTGTLVLRMRRRLKSGCWDETVKEYELRSQHWEELANEGSSESDTT